MPYYLTSIYKTCDYTTKDLKNSDRAFSLAGHVGSWRCPNRAEVELRNTRNECIGIYCKQHGEQSKNELNKPRLVDEKDNRIKRDWLKP